MKYFVLEEHTLIYREKHYPANSYGVLKASIIRGSNFSPLTGSITVSPLERLRLATKDDFRAYNVTVPPDME